MKHLFRNPHHVRVPTILPACLLAFAAGLLSPASHADPGDFQAMPGLWHTTTHVVAHGHARKPTVLWHCVYEDNDPWPAFADLPVPAAHCKRTDEQRTSTSLAWNLSCTGGALKGAHGRVDFDSSQHYTASILTADNRELVHVEGQRRAACTDPSD